MREGKLMEDKRLVLGVPLETVGLLPVTSGWFLSLILLTA
jgi:hypothetical protein